MATKKHCPNCHGIHEFRPVRPKEAGYLQSQDMSKAEAEGHWRCKGNGGHCRWVQPYFNADRGRTLPIGFG